MMKINIEVSGEVNEIMQEIHTLGGILIAANNHGEDVTVAYKSEEPKAAEKPAKKTPRKKETASVEQPPKADAEPEKAAPAPEIVVPAPAAPATEPVAAAQLAPAAQIPTAPAKKYKIEDLLTATAPLMDAGKLTELQALMQKYGVRSMMEIAPERYGELATDLRALGARI